MTEGVDSGFYRDDGISPLSFQRKLESRRAGLEFMDCRFYRIARWFVASGEYGLDFFIAQRIEIESGKPFPKFFQINIAL